MGRDVNDFISALPAARRRKIERQAAQIMNEHMSLQELRRARKLTQTKLAKSLGTAQKNISELERRTDMHISTLRRTVEAMGGELTLTAKFPNGAPIKLIGLAEIEA
jgi:DNA-binding XRE family transcriptional regulator